MRALRCSSRFSGITTVGEAWQGDFSISFRDPMKSHLSVEGKGIFGMTRILMDPMRSDKTYHVGYMKLLAGNVLSIFIDPYCLCEACHVSLMMTQTTV